MKLKILITLLLIGFCVFTRLTPHIWNATPIMPASIFIAMMWADRAAVQAKAGLFGFGAVFLIMFISDIFIGFYDWRFMLANYAALALPAFLGLILAKLPHQSIAQKISFVGLGIGSSILAATIFFILSNFAVWIGGPMYTKDLNGLIQCYTMAVPFFKGSLYGNMAWGALIFGGFLAMDMARQRIQQN